MPEGMWREPTYAPVMAVPRPAPCFAKSPSSSVVERPITREELDTCQVKSAQCRQHGHV